MWHEGTDGETDVTVTMNENVTIEPVHNRKGSGVTFNCSKSNLSEIVSSGRPHVIEGNEDNGTREAVVYVLDDVEEVHGDGERGQVRVEVVREAG